MDNEVEYCGPNRVFPMPWLLVVRKSDLLAVGGWDESYLRGLCYEDNDLLGRLVLRTGGFACDWTRVVYHQSHQQPAYAVSDPGVKAANDRNCAWTQQKWGGIPFDKENTPFDVTRIMDPSGLFVHKAVAEPGKLEKAIEMTTGIVKEAACRA